MVKLNDEIIGGLVSALSRGESLEKAMMTFYNAGYEKEEIEDSAKDVYNKVGSQVMGIKGSLQETLDEIAFKAGVKKKEENNKEAGKTLSEEEKLVLQPIPDKKEVEEEFKKANSNVKQNVSGYGSDNFNSSSI
jgi:predicted ribosome quality control (RQC) complex YloA/Tae2 family protein